MHKILGPGAARAATLAAVFAGTVGLGAGCGARQPRLVAGVELGGPAPGQAVERFLVAARTGDVRTMAAVFGTSSGSVAARDPAPEVEKRMRALACYLGHDRARLIDDAPAVRAGRVLTVELTQRELVRRPRFTVVAGPRGRWYVESFDIETLSDFCRPGS